MESGNIVEYIDRQKIICAVVTEIKNQRLRLLNEHNREVNLSASRLAHKSKTRLDLSMGRDKLVEALKDAANQRRILTEQVDIKLLWEVLNTEQEWIDLATMTEFCFPDNSDGDHEAAVVRAFFRNRTYFKFNFDQFFPNTEDQVARIIAQAEETSRKNRIIETGGDWLKHILNNDNDSLSPPDTDEKQEIIKILKSLYLFEKESPFYELGKAMLDRAGIDEPEMLFQFFIKLNIWNENENTDLYRYGTPVSFSDEITQCCQPLMTEADSSLQTLLHNISQSSALSTQHSALRNRRDLTMLPLMTIDGHATLDFDDALSLEDKGDYYCVGVHIADVGYYVKKDDPIDQEARNRASSIYMPDQKIPMLPTSLSEDICSLKADALRPAVSILINLDMTGEIMNYEIVPSIIKIKHQYTYYDVNMVAEEDKEISVFHDIARKFRQKRLDNGAVQISLPEVSIWVDENNEIMINRTDRESPGRMLIAELMIMANWMMAKFLADHGLPAIYRSQAEPRGHLYKDDEGTLFQNWMQRKLLSRFVLSPEPERHSGLGLDAYVTATSPIRKYSDLVTQRQILSVFDMETPYTAKEIEHIIQTLDEPMRYVSKLQYLRKRFWLMKYLETIIGKKEEAVVLSKRRNSYLLLIPEYMIECELPMSSGISLKPEDLIQIKIQHVNARKDVLSVFMS